MGRESSETAEAVSLAQPRERSFDGSQHVVALLETLRLAHITSASSIPSLAHLANTGTDERSASVTQSCTLVAKLAIGCKGVVWELCSIKADGYPQHTISV